jgi:CD2 antigen cytoplasmic tail-binding protein 2
MEQCEPEPSLGGVSRKRKQPDSIDILQREGPLTEPPIDNEYEQFDDDDVDDDDDQAGPSLGREERREIEEAQERPTITEYGDIKITPFNLQEELEEGEFDKAGNFIFKKKKNDDSGSEEDDNWAESIDWADIAKKEKEQKNLDAEMKPEQPDVDEVGRDKISAYKEMLRLMKPDETVKRTIQRLGNDVPKRKPMNKNATKSKMDQKASHNDQSIDVKEARRKLDLMIELAHNLLEQGDTDIYQKSYEDLEEAIN